MRSSEIQVKAQVEEKYVFLYLLIFFVLELYFSSTLPVFPLSPLTCSFEVVGILYLTYPTRNCIVKINDVKKEKKKWLPLFQQLLKKHNSAFLSTNDR